MVVGATLVLNVLAAAIVDVATVVIVVATPVEARVVAVASPMIPVERELALPI